MEVFKLKNEIALITGGGTGLGKGIAKCMLAAGARVVITGRRENILKKACEELGQGSAYYVHDVTDFKAAPKLVEKITQDIGAPTILVNNAGVHLKKPALEIDEAEFQQVLDTHVLGSMAITRAVVPGMIDGGKGSIIFISSMAAIFGFPLVAAYSAAKSAMLGLVRVLSIEFALNGIRVNAVAPGWIDSDMMRTALDSDPERKQKILSRTPMNCFGEPEDIGQAAVYLSSPAAKFITGQQLAVDGGASIGF